VKPERYVSDLRATDAQLPVDYEDLGRILARGRKQLARKLMTRALLAIAAALMIMLIGLATRNFAAGPAVAMCFLLGTLPGWVYLRFVTNMIPTLYDEYVLNLYRLRIDDVANLPRPPRHSRFWDAWSSAQDSREDARNPYTTKFEAIYGPVPRHGANGGELVGGSSQMAGERSLTDTPASAVLLVVVLIVGWIGVFLPELTPTIGDSFRTSEEVTEFLRFGFAGAYVGILSILIRGYFQSYLTIGIYFVAIIRLLSALIAIMAVAIAIRPLLSADVAKTVAFIMGFLVCAGVLASGLRALSHIAVTSGSRRHPSGRLSLLDVDGLSIWYEARLREQGIVDLQDLLSANLGDLLLRARIPVSRLVDWIDQCALLVRLGEGDQGRQLNARLRGMGIRGATDLQLALGEAPVARQELVPDEFGSRLRALLDDALGMQGAVDAVLLRSFKNELNLHHVVSWRSSGWDSVASPEP
jgi:hypothetical protein